ncbi:D-aminoacyl-tRNA deacylase [Meiothermus granaticius]|uniref:D-aminoacyl-tRNA deacylase n=1 Tax=Meiothermus granaticius NBRC 107808 TaxID=1227551 RepID=A0A399FBV9_9DEIN|nr:D-aminoacyl-tRNA deacylase [Meiothermus granaticius]MCL6525423.1 D-tyrosyl-tRNA(Tyr) deacylase [Thermaceae bacterium]RIH92759.1 D-aminoacyl-tRNA deacylase [Meiothermus granaticius NBRC 107808]GEM87338.1 D-aminoacyl-tRNA deacylase [Meiothermus granaticius NBRC 107808]
MRAVIQRVSEAKVVVEGQVVGQIGQGLLVLLGVGKGDTPEDAAYLARKIAGLRIFADSQGKMNLALSDVGGAVLVVSQFTLYGDTRGGNRPSFVSAAAADDGKRLYQQFCALLERQGIPVETGVFQAHMAVHLVNDGPVTLGLDSTERLHPKRGGKP